MSTALSRLHMLTRFGGVITAALPSTLLWAPLPVTLSLTKRFKREAFLKRFHFMVAWARYTRKNILRIDLSVDGRHNIPSDTRGHMFVSNHQSYVDIPLLMEALNTVAFLSKNLVKYIPLININAYAGGTIFFNRKNKQSRQQALDDTMRMCKESTAVVIFPEGTRSTDGNLREKIYPSAIEAAYYENIKVIPVGLHGTWRVLPKSMDRVNLGEKAAVTVGQVINPRDYSSSRAWVDAVWSAVAKKYAQSRQRVTKEDSKIEIIPQVDAVSPSPARHYHFSDDWPPLAGTSRSTTAEHL
jgi:1-acyl-sn-glycerol-3-phosphate acyltransferase